MKSINKKGSTEDVLFIAIGTFMVAVLCVIAFYGFGQVFDNLMTNPSINSTPKALNTLSIVKTTMEKFDYFVLIVYIALVIGLLVFAFLVGGNPLFMFFYMLGVIVIVFVSSIISYVFGTFMASGAISSYVGTTFAITQHILGNLPYYVAIPAVIGLIVMFIKPAIFETR